MVANGEAAAGKSRESKPVQRRLGGTSRQALLAADGGPQQKDKIVPLGTDEAHCFLSVPFSISSFLAARSGVRDLHNQ